MIRDNQTRHKLLSHEKRTTKTSREGTTMSCAGLTLGKIIFGYTPRVVYLPSNLFRLLQWNRYIDREKTFPTMGWMQFRHIKKVKRFFVRQHLPAKYRSVGFYSNSLINVIFNKNSTKT